ncbi:hypothetical protein HZS_2120 [Henneguya salminicola]|nr:hypothetical protein HZS_2120 [Henneguya salminicola]
MAEQNLEPKPYVKYYSNVPPTIEGMLGGFGYLSSLDISTSETALNYLLVINKNQCKGLNLKNGLGIPRN